MRDSSSDEARRSFKLRPELILKAYELGHFPMASSRDELIQWHDADPRAILPLNAFHVPASLARKMRRNPYRITRDRAFERVIHACQAPTASRPETWINDQIVEAYTELHHMGIGHSVEAWSEDGQLVGGLYGLSMGAAFFGESMFSTQTDASKICLVHLVQHLNARGYKLLDSQIANDHMKQFGQIEISSARYMRLLGKALEATASWDE